MTGPQGHSQLCEFQTQSVHVYCVPHVNMNSPNTVSFSKSSFLPGVVDNIVPTKGDCCMHACECLMLVTLDNA